MERLYRTIVKPRDGVIEGILMGCCQHTPKATEYEDGSCALDVITDIYSYEAFKNVLAERKRRGVKDAHVEFDIFNKPKSID